MARTKNTSKSKAFKSKQLTFSSGAFLLLCGIAVFLSKGCDGNPLSQPRPVTEGLQNTVENINKNIENNGVPSTSAIIVAGIDAAQNAAERGLNKASDTLNSANNQAGKVGDRINEAMDSIATMASTEADQHSAVTAKNYGPFDIDNCYVIKIADGDTATCLKEDRKTQVKIRFAQIDAPESKQDFGTVSKQALSDMIFNKHISLNVEEVDRYGRNVAEVFIDGINVNKYMVKNGYAWAYKEYMTDPMYSELQTQAQKAKEGLWSHKNPMYPQDFRKKQAAVRESKKQGS